MSLISLVIALAILGLVLWVVQQVPMDDSIRKLIRVVVVVAVALYMLRMIAGMSAFDIKL